jgi:membrane fusion protein (multidrug efflux system)
VLALAAVVAAVALVVGARFAQHALTHESTDDAFLEAHTIPIGPRVAGHIVAVFVNDNQVVKKGEVLVELDKRDLELKLAIARADLEAAAAHEKAARANVELTRVTGAAAIDQAGRSLEGARAQIESARAQGGTAKARLDQAGSQVAVADAFLEQAKADVGAAAADDVRSAEDLKRYEEAIADNSVSRQELDHARAEAASARAKLAADHARIVSAEAQVAEAHAALETQKQSVRLAESQVVEAEARKGEAEARLASAKAAPFQLDRAVAEADEEAAAVARAREAVKQAELELSYATLVAPEAGRVTRKSVDVGAYVVVGQPVLSIVPPEVWVVANFKETQLRRMRPGQKVLVRADAYPDRPLAARVESLQAGTGARFSLLPPENATGNYVKVVQRIPVKIVFDEPLPADLELAPGMSVEPEVDIR